MKKFACPMTENSVTINGIRTFSAKTITEEKCLSCLYDMPTIKKCGYIRCGQRGREDYVIPT